MNLTAIGINLAVCAGVVVVVLAVTFAVSLRRRRWDTIDTVWGLGFAAIALVSFGLSAGHGDLLAREVITGMTVVWGVRLAVHLHLRNRGKPEDRRYVEIAGAARGNPAAHIARRVFLPQGVVMWLVSLPAQVGQYATGTSWLTWLGVAVWVVGFTFETVGDLQLSRFASDPSSRGKVLDTGLWRYTRHPNYFGDACVWWGIYLTAAGEWPGASTIIGPVLMTFLLARGTGKPLTEKHLASSRPGYADYVARTSGFLPLPPRKTQPKTNRSTA